MFGLNFLFEVDSSNFWSDGGLHFRNKVQIWILFNEEDLLVKNVTFEVNYTENHHGRRLSDQLSDNNDTGLQHNTPKEEIKLLANRLDVERFELHADCLVIEGFKKFLNFVADEEDIVGRLLIGVPDNEEIRFAMKSISRHVKSILK
ncbi:MAG: hypothetical protein EZS28_004019 [Streblomastix strix]|uniref:Uncharacterized protein n=1 Tax=Streblomastix strix TaxID=222440 RepID=A0A5J4X1F6_9EUKA|nr:MAG: hypothetical protein EZS28_004019 [Streblomastix strix]